MHYSLGHVVVSLRVTAKLFEHPHGMAQFSRAEYSASLFTLTFCNFLLSQEQ